MPSSAELLASNRTEEELARYIGADSLVKLATLDEQEAHVQFEQADSRAMDANILKDEYNMNYIVNRGYKRSSR